jgi:hypothetical protein
LIRVSVYGEALLGLLAATQDAEEPLQSVYLASTITSIAIAISAVVKLCMQTMSSYHLHIVICYLAILGGPMLLASLKLENMSLPLQTAQFIWAAPTLAFIIYAAAIQDKTGDMLVNCGGNPYSISYVQILAIVIDVFAMSFVYIVLQKAINEFKLDPNGISLGESYPLRGDIEQTLEWVISYLNENRMFVFLQCSNLKDIRDSRVFCGFCVPSRLLQILELL